jgi:hypothetical protein
MNGGGNEYAQPELQSAVEMVESAKDTQLYVG